MAYHKKDYRSYIDGNTVRRLESVPRRRVEGKPSDVTKPIIKRKSKNMDVLTFLILAAAVIVTLYICVSYLRIQINITTLNNDIVSLESEIANRNKQNDIALEALESSVDLAGIYEKAIHEFGMVHANGNQVYSYESKKSDRVRQYLDIPQE